MKDALWRQLLLLGEASTNELAAALGVSETEADSVAKSLVDDGRAEECGRWENPRRERHWVHAYKALVD